MVHPPKPLKAAKGVEGREKGERTLPQIHTLLVFTQVNLLPNDLFVL